MNKELLSKGNEVLDFILITLQQGKDFVLEQAPDIVRQMIEYLIIDIKIDMIIDLIILLICVFFSYFSSKMLKNIIEKKNEIDYEEDNELSGVGFTKTIISSIILSFSIIFFLTNLNTSLLPNYKKYLQITRTPKAYLIYSLTKDGEK